MNTGYLKHEWHNARCGAENGPIRKQNEHLTGSRSGNTAG